MSPDPIRQAPDRICDVCGGSFTLVRFSQLRCSEECTRFARKHKRAPRSALRRLWAEAKRAREHAERGTCPTGKRRHPTRAAAKQAAATVEKYRFGGLPGWLRVYECEKCLGFHKTSKPKIEATPCS